MTMENSDQAFAALHPDDRAVHRPEVERVVREGGSWSREMRINRAGSGEPAWIESRATAITDEEGRVVRVVGVLADITGRKNVEEEIRRRNQELERTNSELEEFTYVASHDLQEPLRAVNIYTQLLLNRTGLRDDPQASQFAGFIEQGVNRMESLIRDLLGYARIVHRDQDPPGQADLNRSLEETLHTLNGFIRGANGEISYDKLPVVFGDERQLSQVFQNVLSNCVKYRRKDTPLRIRLETQRTNGDWLISIADNGIGFDPQYAERIFGLFKRLHTDDYPGTGLGLAICRRVVERCGGRIWATSEGEGRGATVCFTLKSVDA
jgi:light-regulated signal transduction histidine kinase (bacteriophytochrome)